MELSSVISYITKHGSVYWCIVGNVRWDGNDFTTMAIKHQAISCI